MLSRSLSTSKYRSSLAVTSPPGLETWGDEDYRLEPGESTSFVVSFDEIPVRRWVLLVEGEVLAVGSGARNEKGEIVPLDVKAGDKVLFGKWSGTEVKINGEELLIMKESDIMGVLEKTAAKKTAKKKAA